MLVHRAGEPGARAGRLELLAADGAAAVYRGDLGRSIVEHLRETGGRITLKDLAGYRVVRRRPVTAAYRDHVLLSNPPPSSGGVLIGYGLRLLDRLRSDAGAGSAEAIAELVEVMREQTRARQGSFSRDLYRGRLPPRLYSNESLRPALARMRRRLPAPQETAAR